MKDDAKRLIHCCGMRFEKRVESEANASRLADPSSLIFECGMKVETGLAAQAPNVEREVDRFNGRKRIVFVRTSPPGGIGRFGRGPDHARRFDEILARSEPIRPKRLHSAKKGRHGPRHRIGGCRRIDALAPYGFMGIKSSNARHNARPTLVFHVEHRPLLDVKLDEAAKRSHVDQRLSGRKRLRIESARAHGIGERLRPRRAERARGRPRRACREALANLDTVSRKKSFPRREAPEPQRCA